MALHRGLPYAFALAVLASSGFADADEAAAEALFLEAKALSEEGRFEEACPKFEASYELDATLGTLLNLANCNEERGRIASAHAQWEEAREIALSAGDDRAEFAGERAEALEPRLPKLTILITRPTPGLGISRDGEPVAEAAWGTPVAVDPGRHTITVSRGTTSLEEQSIELAEAEAKSVSLDLSAIAARHPVEAPPPAIVPVPTPAPKPPPAPFWNGQRTWGAVISTVGLAGIGAFGILEAMALSAQATADEPSNCQQKVCAPQGTDAAEDAEILAETGQWVGVGGAVVFVVGATIFLTAGSDDEAPAVGAGADAGPRWIAPWAGESGGGLAIGGEF